MRLINLTAAAATAALLGLLSTTPAAAAQTGVVCGQVTEFVAPAGPADGAITIGGSGEVIDASVVIDASDVTALEAVATSDETTCLDLVADSGGTIVGLAIAPAAEICSLVALDSGSDEYSVDGVRLPGTALSANAQLAALLAAAASNGTAACVDVTTDPTTALISDVVVTGTFTACGVPTVDEGTTMVGGVEVPLDAWANEFHFEFDAVKIADSVDAPICVEAEVEAGEMVLATLSADITECGPVVIEHGDSPTVGRAFIDATITSGAVWHLGHLAAASDADACVRVVAPGQFVFDVTLTVDRACAQVIALGDGTVTVTFAGPFRQFEVALDVSGVGDLDVEVGDTVCVAAHAGALDHIAIVTDIETVRGPLLPDTASSLPPSPAFGGAMMVVAALGIASATALRQVAAAAAESARVARRRKW